MRDKSKNKVIGAFLGTIIEYYDYSLYGFSASIIALKFFPNADPLTSLMDVFAVYAVAYLSKPIGAVIFGRIGDIYGRKIVLNITIIGIVVPTIIIGLLPTYSSIGTWSAIILVLCRFMQGIFVAGEYDGAAIYVIEHLGKKYRSTASAVTRFTGVVGILLGVGMTNFFSSHIFPDWSWRIPFLISLPLALVVLYFRQRLDETPEFRINKEQSIKIDNLNNLLRKQWRVMLRVIFLAGGFGVTYQIAIIFMKQYLPIVMPQSTLIISTFSVLIVLCFAVAMPIAGLLADRFSELIVIRVSLFGTIFASLLFIIGVSNEMLNLVLVSCLMLACFVAPINALAHGIFVKAFSVNTRYRAISLGHTIGAMLMGGSANYVCLAVMKTLKFKLFPIIYLIIFAILAYYTVRKFERDYNKKGGYTR
ncbi:MFS transporter [Candidatus Tisiphia endosymbiont of Nemotelus uliginosus]|uniref:MFS transporter n=1 Tax=Candidatus Tisiphia endosymbiont of Nemotelus uliginosus TaxID=3077926 RepID=UPI0035C8FDC7